MPDAAADLIPLQAVADAIVTGGRTMFSWTWDDRFHAALSTFPRRAAPEAQALLRQHLPGHWTSDSLRDAPPAVLTIAASLGGLRADQELLLSDLDRSVVLCACWWPWGDAATVSLRLTLSLERLPEADRPRLLSELRGWFGL